MVLQPPPQKKQGWTECSALQADLNLATTATITCQFPVKVRKNRMNLFFLKRVYVVPLEAGIDVYVSVNVFGIIRIRADWFVANNEILKARTALEIMAVEHKSGRLIMPPQDVGAESEYNEQYVLWAGPLTVRKIMRKLETPLCDFSDLATAKTPPKFPPKRV